MVADRLSARHRLLPACVLIGLIFLFAFLTISSFLRKSPTYDEAIHLFAGYSYLRWGDFRTNPEHPPLAKVLAALPLLALDIRDPRPSSPYWGLILRERDYSWVIANQMIFLENDAETLFFYAKLPMIALGILLGIFIHLWAKGLYGMHAASAALFIYCLDPNILANSQIVHTDIPFTTFFFISTYFFWRTLTQLSWSNLLWTSLFFGLAAITKYSFLTILPIWGILGMIKIFSSVPLRSGFNYSRWVSSRWGKAVLLTAILGSALITAYLFIWAAYALRFNAVPNGGDFHLPLTQVMPESPILQSLISLGNQYHLFPEAWIYGLLSVFTVLRRLTYLLGQISGDGVWLYFPVAFAVKTPLPTLLLLLVTVGVLISERKDRMAELFLLIPVAVYFSLAVWSHLNIGLRHLLPVYPFLFVLLGGTVAELWNGRTKIKRGALILLGLWYLWTSVSIYPHYLAFFNGLVGGSKNGYKVLADSNLDWGQDLKGLKRWMDRNGVKKIQLAYFGSADPGYYGIDALCIPGSLMISSCPKSKNPEVPNHLAISVTYIQGVYGTYTGKVLRELVESLRLRTPIATIGHSIFVYRLD